MSLVVLTDKDYAKYLERLQAIAPGHSFVIAADDDALERCLPEAEIILGWKPLVTEHCLKSPDSPLRWMQAGFAGVDAIPLELCRQKGIYLTTVSGIHANPISEVVFGVMLAFARGLKQCILNQSREHWEESQNFLGSIREIHGKTIGVIGAGAIGAEVAHIAKAFSMRVLGLNTDGIICKNFDAMYTAGELSSLLPECDYIVNILPLTNKTRGIIGRDEFSAMKQGAYYVSVGRGATTDTAALMEALDSGRLAGAGLDVTDPEPLPPGHKLWTYPNVIIMPHISGDSPYYDERVIDIFAENLEAYCKGKPLPLNLVDYDKGY